MGFLNKLKSGAKGILSGASTEEQILPVSKILSQYNFNGQNMFKVRMQAFDPPKLIVSTEGLQADVPAVSLYDFEVLYSDSTLAFQHSHQWGESDAGNLLKKAGGISNMFNKVSDILASGNITNGAIEAGLNTAFNKFNSIDVADTYQGSGKQSFTVKYYVIAYDDPLKEVVYPSLMITYFSYPRLSEKQPKSLVDLAGSINKTLKKEDGPASVTSGSLPDGGNDAGEATIGETVEGQKEEAKTARAGIEEAAPGIFRHRAGTPPPTWIVTSSNGLVYFPSCHIKNLNVTYYGPWLKAPPADQKSNFLSALKGAAGAVAGGGALPMSEIFPSANPISTSSVMKNVMDQGGAGQNWGGLPSYAEISITFESNFTQMFGEEWLFSMMGKQSDKVKTSVKKSY